MTLTIFHNPRCSKSRQTLQILENRGLKPTIIEYLKAPLSEGELVDILNKLNLKPRELLRKGEKAYKELGLSNPDLDDKQLITAMIENPVLIERPIVLSPKGARIGRPPESIVEIL
ncbi:arsenate reductase (glutaredoxin) [Rhodospirillales bacterium 47_12_T64]|nr:arsenate reductase (glutaredoxin) [Rhodospirillales bacterium 47_12_T64]